MIILASASPRRKILMHKIFKDFIVIAPEIDERNYKFPINKYALELSKLKANSVYENHKNDTILACDTIVIYKGKIFNKPRNNEEAKMMLKELSNHTHTVVSGYTYINKNIRFSHIVKTKVKFNNLSDKLINEYVDKGFSKGKAGAYGIQDNYDLVKYIKGSLDNVIGLPTEDIIEKIKLYGH